MFFFKFGSNILKICHWIPYGSGKLTKELMLHFRAYISFHRLCRKSNTYRKTAASKVNLSDLRFRIANRRGRYGGFRIHLSVFHVIKGRIPYLYNHRLDMELDLQSLFGLHVHSCAHWLRPHNSRPPHSGSFTRALLSAKIDDISL